MYSFIVLGIIPGTDIQIGFWPTMGLIAASLVAFKIYKPRLTRVIRDWWHQYDDVEDPAHRPPHASSLHRRLPKLPKPAR
ncbi:MAG TPA: hypothetical protein VFX84_02190 [Candidatus Saccharimonadales bacterium]|nr:hypothetical protein [Candidatus Saccharimonadales bacterium]